MNKAAAFAVCSLFAATGTMLAQPTPGPTGLDHFNCYFAPGDVHPVSAYLQDQFDVAPPSTTFVPGSWETVTDVRPFLFCNPTLKNYNGVTTQILNPAAHLMMYLINPQPSIPRQVTVQNQFGTSTLHTGKAEVLAVPSGKTTLVPAALVPPLPPIPAQGVLDHFKCYIASGDNINATVTLRDQFLTETTKVLRPVFFCNPVEKVTVNTANPVTVGSVVTPITHPTLHLTCYLTTPVQSQHVVLYNNQFVVPGALPTLTLTQSELLCVPSLKLAWSVVAGPPLTGVANPGN
jgi:hypothetical protein